MSTSLAAQLSQIAAKSTNSLNLKAQKIAYSKSLIFDAATASSQDIDTLYTICAEGFNELCLLDHRFRPFARSVFSEQSKAEDRTQMTQSENDELDRVLEAFLALAGGRLLLKPAVKAVEWLVRRFRFVSLNCSSETTFDRSLEFTSTTLHSSCSPSFLSTLRPSSRRCYPSCRRASRRLSDSSTPTSDLSPARPATP